MSNTPKTNFNKIEWLTGRATVMPMSWVNAGLHANEWKVGMHVLNVTTAQTNEKTNDVAGQARIAASTIAEATGINSKNVSRALRALEDKGCITKTWQGNAKTGLSNVYMVNDPPLSEAEVAANRQALAERRASTGITHDTREDGPNGTGITHDTTGITCDTTGITCDTTGIAHDTTGITGDVPSESSSESISESKSESFSETPKGGDQTTTTGDDSLKDGLTQSAGGGLKHEVVEVDMSSIHFIENSSLEPYIKEAVRSLSPEAIAVCEIRNDGVVVYPSDVSDAVFEEVTSSGLTTMDASWA